jgi:mycofactocin precursor
MTESRTSQLALSGESVSLGEPSVGQASGDENGAGGEALTSEMLVEEVSIDGMCGVY